MAKTTAETILNIARAEVGTQATNYKRCKYNTDFYGYVVSASWADWCAVFIWWIFNKAGAADLLYVKTAGCGVLGSAFYNRGRFKTGGYRAGDVVFFHWSNEMSESVPITYTLDHVGIIEKVNSDGSYTTIEGNTGGGNGAVMRRTRYASQISGVARPDYSGSQVAVDVAMVKTVQSWLNSAYKAGLYLDGIYGGRTELALIKALQTELNRAYHAGLAVDGIYGEKTYAAVRSWRQGSRGDYVKVLQGFLICKGYDTGGFDGSFGARATSSVRAFQSRNGLVVDGIAGKKTFRALTQ